jgi:hypothetical protein
MHVHDLLGWPGPMTHRQYLAWQAWLDEEWERPNRTDQYLMQVALEVVRGRMKNPRKAELQNFRLTFKGKKTLKRPKLTKEQVTIYSKARWLGMMTKPVQKVVLTREEWEARQQGR